jgi:hypothetical protein
VNLGWSGKVIVCSNKGDVIGRTLILKSGWCVLWSRDAANFLIRALKLFDNHERRCYDNAQDEGLAYGMPVMSAQYRHIARA